MALTSRTGGDSRIEIEVDVNAVRNALRRLDKEAEKLIRDVVKQSTIKARNKVRDYAPQATGLLSMSVRSRTQFTQSKTRGLVTVDGPARTYAWIVEHGSKSTNAFPGRKYIQRAGDEVVPEFVRNVNRAVDQAIEAAGLTE